MSVQQVVARPAVVDAPVLPAGGTADQQAFARSFLGWGQQAARAGDVEVARRLLDWALELDPIDEEALLWRAATTPDTAQALACLERVLALDPRNERAQRGLADLRWRAGLPPLALDGRKSPGPGACGRPRRRLDQKAASLALGLVLTTSFLASADQARAGDRTTSKPIQAPKTPPPTAVTTPGGVSSPPNKLTQATTVPTTLPPAPPTSPVPPADKPAATAPSPPSKPPKSPGSPKEDAPAASQPPPGSAKLASAVTNPIAPPPPPLAPVTPPAPAARQSPPAPAADRPWVAVHRATGLWSGPDAGAVLFKQVPPGTELQLARPQDGPRLYVWDPVVKNYAYVDALAVGPADAPVAKPQPPPQPPSAPEPLKLDPKAGIGAIPPAHRIWAGTARVSMYTCVELGGCNRTASGVWPYEGVVAVDPRVIPLGSTVWIDGLGTFLAADTGSAIYGNRIDVFAHDYHRAIQWGVRYVEAVAYRAP
jgi:3D (Asp-Asp-Asp) domain-containing protein